MRGRDLAPVSALPLWYFAFAYAAITAALGVLLIDPGMPAGIFYQPKVIAVVHLVTVGWLTGSILGAFYIVAPLALGLPMRVTAVDWIVFGSYAIGAAGMVSHFWIATYDGMAWSALMVILSVALAAYRATRGIRHGTASGAVTLHLGLAVLNLMAAGIFGMLIGFDRSRGTMGVSSIAAVYAHAHLAAIGWVLLMVIGMSYRLLPMMLPAAIPTGPALYISAIAIEAGLVVLFVALLEGSAWLLAGALSIVAGIASFILQIRKIFRTRRPRPPALPRRDWSTRQTQAAMASLIVAAACGIALSTPGYGEWRRPVAWIYGVAGIAGFLAQMVAGVQGRIVPWYAWYRAQTSLVGDTATISANALPSAAHAATTFAAWTIGVPLLAAGLAGGGELLVRAGSLSLLAGSVTGAAHIVHMLRRSRSIDSAATP